ncbi:hypothetical protein CQA53_10015 [Helicobacter didelphidarum]|uniref:Uncharacterized protein n=1 Tax=Helicobacter didelphidarum TaxID=2040648 RepID=A0A3D8I8Q9_9HELI|nr:hypothetical protein [Helicobacter didelphidarum]RDU61539.1 hypothetical protein CQA53_10015 [Helicobacter didelphidarum]
MNKLFLIICLSLSICFNACETQDTSQANIERAFEMMEKQIANPLPIIANIVLKIDKIPQIDEIKSSLDSTQKITYNDMLEVIKSDDWDAPLRAKSIESIATYLLDENSILLQKDTSTFCSAFDEFYTDSKNLEILRILDESILDNETSAKTISQREPNLHLISENHKLSFILANLLQSFNKVVLNRYKQECRG